MVEDRKEMDFAIRWVKHGEWLFFEDFSSLCDCAEVGAAYEIR